MFCGRDELVSMHKLARVLQTMLIELMVHEISLRNGTNLSKSVYCEMH